MTLLALSLRSVVRGRRALVVGLLPMLVALVAVLLTATADGGDRTGAYGTLVGDLLLPLVIALVALVLGVNAFGDERDERTLGLLLATTLPRTRIVVVKYAAAAAVTWLVCLPAALGCLLLPTDLPTGTVVWSLLVSTALAAAAYTALFVLLSLLLPRAVLVGLAYLVIWEGLLASTATTFRNLSVGAYANGVAGAPWSLPPFPTADSTPVASALVLLGVIAVAVAAAAWRLPRTHL